jgi:predicted ATP-grasp superfamily ATP-dependent carboligase
MPVSVFDLFGDHDTQQICLESRSFFCHHRRGQENIAQAYRIGSISGFSEARLGKTESDGASELDRLLEDFSVTHQPVIVFTGGTENQPSLFCSVGYRDGIVAGPKADSVSRLLSLDQLQGCCRRHEIATPQSIHSGHLPENTGESEWLRKNIRSGGGLHVKNWTCDAAANESEVDFDAGFYLQRKIKGPTVSGCYIAAKQGKTIETQLLGCCTGHKNLNDTFRYQGSYGPNFIEPSTQAEMDRVGRYIANDFGLVGVFGIDFVLHQAIPWLVDINPRIPASAEIIEEAYRVQDPNFTIVSAHLDACLGGKLPSYPWSFLRPPRNLFSKRVIYSISPQPLRVNQKLLERLLRREDVTDLPRLGSEILPGHPFLTLHSSATDLQTLLKRDQESNRQLQSILQ